MLQVQFWGGLWEEGAASAPLGSCPEETGFSLSQVDCTANSNTCNKYGVSGYPTLKIFRNGEESGTYDGPRTAGEKLGLAVQALCWRVQLSSLAFAL